jgi:A/G-specific adenine glycosylase
MTWPASDDLLAPLAPWFDRAHRDLPWRAQDLDAPHPDPYAVLVSELMLQQTQVATVVPYFQRWMDRFPTAAALAEADEDTVYKAWEGLGYYRRARFLKAAAGAIAAEGWPVDLEGLTGLPGLGPYTAAALGAIAFQWPTPALDGNAFRVLARLLLLEGDPKEQAAALRPWLAPALVEHGPSRMTQALMELGAKVCMPAPHCPTCPLSPGCQARMAARTAEIPPTAKRAKVTSCALWLVAFEAREQILLQSPKSSGLLAGLWRFPAFEVAEFPPQLAVQEPGTMTAWPGWTQVYTHRRELVTPLLLRLETCFSPTDGLQWIPVSNLRELPLGKRDQRLRDLLESPGAPPPESPDVDGFIRTCAAPSP